MAKQIGQTKKSKKKWGGSTANIEILMSTSHVKFVKFKLTTQAAIAAAMGSFAAEFAELWCLCVRFFPFMKSIHKNCETSSSNPYPILPLPFHSIAATAGDSVESKEIHVDLRAVLIHLDVLEMPVSFKHRWTLEECQCQWMSVLGSTWVLLTCHAIAILLV